MSTTRILAARAPFRFDLALGYLARSSLEVLDVVEGGVYRRALHLNGERTLIEVAASDHAAVPELRLRILTGPRDGASADAAEALVRRCFRLEEDLQSLEARSAADPSFGALVSQFRGLRALLMCSPLEALVWAIIGQQINVQFAYRLKRALVEQLGERLEHNGRIYYLFPTAERLAAQSPDSLRALQFSRQKADYVLALARQVTEGELELATLGEQPPDEARAQLMTLRGVGRWTAEYVLMRGYGARDELPAADIGLQNAAAQVYGLTRRPNEAELRALAEPWSGWRSYYAFYLWYSIAPGSM